MFKFWLKYHILKNTFSDHPYTSMHTLMHAYTHTHTHTHACTCPLIGTHMHVFTYILYIYTHTQSHIHVHTDMHVYLGKPALHVTPSGCYCLFTLGLPDFLPMNLQSPWESLLLPCPSSRQCVLSSCSGGAQAAPCETALSWK